jgi:hypothetical protein
VSDNNCEADGQRRNRWAAQEIIQEGQLLDVPATAGTAEHAIILPSTPCRVHGPVDSFRPVRKYLRKILPMTTIIESLDRID